VLTGYEDYPVVNVTWQGAQIFCSILNGKQPSEAEWEFAARGGVYAIRSYTGINKDDFEYEYRFAGGNVMTERGWFVDNSYGRTHKVGMLKPNQLGIFDMCGNVWEWCYDKYNKDFYKNK
jgi:formylglycine-generating enzyme required for sulfatase activity